MKILTRWFCRYVCVSVVIDIVGWYIAWTLIDNLIKKYKLNKNTNKINIVLTILFITYLIMKVNYY